MIDIQDVKRINLHQGDVLVVQVKGVISKSQADMMRDWLRDVFKDNRVLVVDEKVSLMVVDCGEEHF